MGVKEYTELSWFFKLNLQKFPSSASFLSLLTAAYEIISVEGKSWLKCENFNYISFITVLSGIFPVMQSKEEVVRLYSYALPLVFSLTFS